MTQVIEQMLSDQVPRARVQVPGLPSWLVPRRRLADRLDLGVSGLLTVVTGATGWGKTVGVAAWATTAEAPGRLIWLNVAGADADPDLFWTLIRDALIEAGERHLAPVPEVGSHERHRLHALAVLGATLRRSGPWVVVLDDYPSGPVGRLGRDLELVLDHARRGLRLVLISRAEPAMEIQRHHVSGELTRIARPELAMDSFEVAELHARHEVDASDITARVVERHTRGWPCAVRLAAVAMQDTPTVEAALEVADRATIDYLASEVLAKTPTRVRNLIVHTSMVEEVSPELARTVLGSADDVVLDPAIASDGLVEVGPDGSFRCHPLLRAAALAELSSKPRGVTLEQRRRAAQWYLDRGEASTGLELAMAGEDWPWVARALLESYAVPRILMGTADEVVDAAIALDPVRAAEPIIHAAVVLRHVGAAAAEAELDGAVEPSTASEGIADRISAAFVRLVAARARGDWGTGIGLATRVRELMTHLRVEQQDELSAMLDAHVGALELCSGEIHRSAITLRHGMTRTQGGGETAGARSDCLGQLALLEAYQGNLRLAQNLAAPVLKGGAAVLGPGVAHAHLAQAWVHLERAEPVPARQHLDRALEAGRGDADPWFAMVQLMAEARLLIVTGHPEAALRQLVPAMPEARHAWQSGWMLDLLTIASADALLAAGEPQQALDLLTPVPVTMPAEGGVLTAAARVELGDVAGARAALTPVAGTLAGVPLEYQVECWLLEAGLAHEAGHSERARGLVDRALRAAGAEALRKPFGPRYAWLAELVDRDATLRRAHGGFLTGLKPPSFGPAGTKLDSGRSGTLLIETLTVREAQVLGLLAEMCSTDEIARELFLSVNTVKTYVRGILRKLCVNRRVDAVRRGRELGLC